MKRLWLAAIPLLIWGAADAEKDSGAVIVTAATELSAGEAEGFLGAFDPSMTGYQKLRDDVTGLIEQANLTCSIEVVRNDGDEGVRSLTLDWILNLEPKGENPTRTQRHKTVKVEMRKNGKKWRIVSFEPLDLFAPG